MTPAAALSRSPSGRVSFRAAFAACRRRKRTNRGEPVMRRESSRRKLVFGWSHPGPDHEADMRFGDEAPGWRAHSNSRFNDHVPDRVTTTSDRHRQRGKVA
jgi:hypothetical protein